jgi:prevent-host-death family protein
MSNAYTHRPLQNALSPNLAWPVQDAKARFSEFLDTCLAKGPQVITRRGTQTAVLVPFEQWQRMSQQAKPTLRDWLLEGVHPKLLAGEEVSDEELGIKPGELSAGDLLAANIPARGQGKNRPPMVFE